MNEHSKGISYFWKRNSVSPCYVNKPPRPVGTGRRLSGGLPLRKVGKSEKPKSRSTALDLFLIWQF